MTAYTVKDGDCMSSIGHQFGLPWRYIWERGENAGLRSMRQPEILLAGDIVYVPDLEQGNAQRATGAAHRFQLAGASTKIRIKLLYLDEPRANLPAVVEGDGFTASLQTDGKGVLECRIPANATKAKVTLTNQDGTPEVYNFTLGGLDPIDSVSGLQQRLLHLGFAPGPADNIYGARTEAAVRRFQYKVRIVSDGIAGPITKSKLLVMHGS